MLVKRNSDTIKKDSNINKTEVTKKPLFSDIEIKTFRDEVFETLEVLEKQGTNIYDTNRFGGMYLKQKKSDDKLPSSLKSHFAQSTVEDNSKPTINNLIDFFK